MDPADLRQRIERAKADNADPAERDVALTGLETELTAEPELDEELTDLLGLIRTYRGDARLQIEGASNGS